MDIQTLELTDEDILSIHRYYITCLYLEDKKTEVEIVGLLYERCKLQVTVSQIRKCIRDWKLELPVSSELQPEEPDAPSDDGWEIIPAMTASPAPPNASHTPSDPKIMSLYTKRPLPSLPTSKPSPKMDSKSRVRKRQPPNSDRVRAICHHGAGSSDSHEVESTLSSVPDGPSQIEMYIDDNQDHERVALGLMSFARAGQFKEGTSRHRFAIKTMKKTTKDMRDKRKESERQGSPSNQTRGRETSDES